MVAVTVTFKRTGGRERVRERERERERGEENMRWSERGRGENMR